MWKRFVQDQGAAAAMEYVIIGALATAILVPILVAIFNTLKTRLEAINNGL